MSADFKKVSLGEPVTYLKPAELIDQPVIGIFLESFEQETKYGKKLNHKFETEEGIVILNGNGNLSSKLRRVDQGATVKIEYLGKSQIKSGPNAGTMAHNYEVYSK